MSNNVKSIIASLMLLPCGAFAFPRLYGRVAELYEKAGVPKTQGLKAESLWTGHCVSQLDPENRTYGDIYFHVERDPVLGDSFYMVPNLCGSGSCAAFSERRERAIDAVTGGDVKSVVTLDTIEGAWTSSRGTGAREVTYYLREGKTLKGDRAFFLKETREGDAPKYCYYYLPVLSDADSGNGTPVAPPADPVQQ